MGGEELLGYKCRLSTFLNFRLRPRGFIYDAYLLPDALPARGLGIGVGPTSHTTGCGKS